MGFVRVRDVETGYHYDLPEGDPRIGNGVTVRLGHYDVADRPRDPKYPNPDLDTSAGTTDGTEES
jgi:hypothetical protein